MKLVAPGEYADAYLDLEYLASEPYAAFVYDTPADAHALARFVFEAGAGEAAPPYGRLALDDDDRVAGMIAYLDADELARARMAAATALVRGHKLSAASPARERMLAAGATLLAVAPDELYLSRIAVADGTRGRGIARELLAGYEAAAIARGKRRLVLEVSPVHPAAIRLYTRCGFAEIARHTTADAATGRELCYLHLAKQLATT